RVSKHSGENPFYLKVEGIFSILFFDIYIATYVPIIDPIVLRIMSSTSKELINLYKKYLK
ncbi:hypothetical protein, partial [Bacillus sp. AFS033286]|uniref:hypothetical protein n=1 Tax=Bacillus sp. AFS033286 TaxID=2033498 RepID=UPI001C3F3BA5